MIVMMMMTSQLPPGATVWTGGHINRLPVHKWKDCGWPHFRCSL